MTVRCRRLLDASTHGLQTFSNVSVSERTLDRSGVNDGGKRAEVVGVKVLFEKPGRTSEN